ncbi:hypothetical protein CCAX7_46370 [Capsulimonas corticalis]|uniref:Uncharacterized protein n=1 Tax=Capsulimonas corticalis TaxID=2219043 RepID=A0A402D4Z2_9BACT|nr:hypothetical protein CCAX7_46370 [Capsulimonas corticalis]
MYIEWMIEPSTPYPHIMQDKSRITTIHSAGKGRISRTLEFDFDSDGWENKGHGSFCQTKEGYIFTVTATGASPSATNSVDDQFMRGEGLGVGGHRTYRLQRRSRKPIQIFPY